MPGYDIAPGDPMLALLAASYREVLGEEPTLAPNPGATYVQTAPGNLTLYGPVLGSADQMFFHAVDERVRVSKLTRNAVMFAHALQSMLQAETLPARAP